MFGCTDWDRRRRPPDHFVTLWGGVGMRKLKYGYRHSGTLAILTCAPSEPWLNWIGSCERC
jgi:hypothetical protein